MTEPPVAPGYQFDHVHRLGSGFVDGTRRALFLNIPKNASSSLAHLLLSAGFRYTTAFRTRPVPPGYTVFAVTRDPVSRWISAMSEYAITVAHRPPEDLTVEHLRRLRDGTFVPLDQHLTPQSTFLLPTMPVTRWLCFERLADDYRTLAADVGLPDGLRRDNRSDPTLSRRLRELLSDHDHTLIRRFYAEDVRLHVLVTRARGGPVAGCNLRAPHPAGRARPEP
ncbi:hypothetical protein [Micromonospora okii]|uniref:hypothetical protein n=1 Tax=Micromonospora okii TaxID=1182970 RepID=UPI001E2ADE7D|nr:hypothetical protein [Micromonospora okii]